MNYNHNFHAGNFADIIKHLTLFHEAKYYKKGNKPIFFLDSHSGLGIYDLYSPEAQRTGEYLNGIEKVKDILKEHFADFYTQISNLNKDGKIRFYPGSSYLMQSLASEEDYVVLIEKNQKIYDQLIKKIKGDNIEILNEDAFEVLNDIETPKAFNNLVLIDPPFEDLEDFDNTLIAAQNFLTDNRNSTIIFWFPVKDEKMVSSFIKKMQLLKMKFYVNYTSNDFLAKGMSKSGVMVINPSSELINYWNFIKEKITLYKYTIENYN